MATATKKTVESLKVGQIQTLNYVDDAKSYRISFQLGQARRWREFSGGKWTKRPSGIGETETTYDHIPAVHVDKGPFSGSIVNGLIALHNRWLQLNRDHKSGGEVQRQFVVLNTEETDEPAIDSAGPNSGLTRLELVIKTAVREAVAAVMEEFTKK